MSNLASRVSGLGANAGFAGCVLPNSSFSGRGPESPPSPMRRALHFLTKRKWRKRFASLRGLSAKSPTQRNSVKRGLRLPHSVRFQSAPKVSVSRPLFPRVTTFARKQGCWLLLLPRELGADPVRRPRLANFLRRTNLHQPSNLSGFLLSGRLFRY